MDTDLARLNDSKRELSNLQIQIFIYQILRALKCVHSADVIHRDIKPQNCLVNNNCDLKIADFGSCSVKKDTVDSSEGDVTTLWYRAPEVLRRCEYSPSSDVWSVGCIFAELVMGKPLFDGKNSSEQELLQSRIMKPSKLSSDKATLTTELGAVNEYWS